MSGRAECRWRDAVVAYAQGELPEAERAVFASHLETCPSCPEQVAAARSLIDRLAAALPDEPARDLAPRVLSQVLDGSWERKPAYPLRWAAAALVTLAVGGAFLWQASEPRPSAPEIAAADPRSAARAEGLTWLAEAQEPDGSWNPARWGGHGNFEVGVTGLALLAFLDGAAEAPRGAHAETVQLAARALLRSQDAAGHFGPQAAGSLYNHAIATAALARLWRSGGEGPLAHSVDRGVAFLARTQAPSGGWGYEAGDAPNASVSAWPILALEWAREAGSRAAEAPLARGLSWLSSVVDEAGRVGYRRPRDFPYGAETLTAVGALPLVAAPAGTADASVQRRLAEAVRRLPEPSSRDYYRDFFVVRTLAALDGADARERGGDLARALASARVTEGPHSGSWAPTDRWSTAGGRVYATAMAAMALAAPSER